MNHIEKIKAELTKMLDTNLLDNSYYDKESDEYIEMPSDTSEKITALAEALNIAVDALDRITDLHGDDGCIMQSRSYEALTTIAKTLSGKTEEDV